MDYTVHGILQARILEWVAVASPGLSLGCCTEKHNQAREWEKENLLIASRKGTLGIFSEAMSTNSKTGKQAKGTGIFMKGLEQRR